MVRRMPIRMSEEERQLEVQWLLEEKAILPFWEWYELYMRSGWWKRLRFCALQRDGFACVQCGASKVKLHVDHLVYSEPGEERMEELQTLCIYCHARKTRKFDILRKSEWVKAEMRGEQLFSAMRKVQDGD